MSKLNALEDLGDAEAGEGNLEFSLITNSGYGCDSVWCSLGPLLEVGVSW